MNETVVEKRTGLAIASLVLSILGMVSYGITSIVGIILGHMAKGKIKKSPQIYGGDGMATAGLILGYLVIAGWLIATLAVGSFFASL